MKIFICGAGRQGQAIAYHLLKYYDVENITVCDFSATAADTLVTKLTQWAGDTKGLSFKARYLDFRSIFVLDFAEILRPFDVLISAASYEYNVKIAEAAIEAQTHMVDLGGNPTVVEEQRKLSAKAYEAGVTHIPDCGLAPGLINIIAADAVQKLGGKAQGIRMRCGGLPVDPVPPLNYMLAFNTEGLLNEYDEPCIVVKDGKKTTIEPLSDIEEIKLEFESTYGGWEVPTRGYQNLEAFNTSGGLSTLADTLNGVVDNMDYKTLRYPGHAQFFATLRDMNFFSKVKSLPKNVSPREYLIEMLERNKSLKFTGKDVVIVDVWAHNENDSLNYNIVDYLDENTGHSAMMRTTGYPAGIIAHMIGAGEIKDRGVLPAELVVPFHKFFNHLEASGIHIVTRD